MGLITAQFTVYLLDAPSGVVHLISDRKPKTWCGQFEYGSGMKPYSPFEKLEQLGPGYLRGLNLCPDCRAHLDWIAEHAVSRQASDGEAYIT